MSLLLYFIINDFLMVVIYVVYHKIRIKTSSQKNLPVFSSEKRVVLDDNLRTEIIKTNTEMKKTVNKQRLAEKQGK